MTRSIPLIWASMLPLLLLAVLGCSHVPWRAAPDPIFVDAAPMLGRTVSVRGRLHWAFEDRNLYPAQGSRSKRRRFCLPMLIRADATPLIDTAKRLHNQQVRVDGVVVNAAPPGRVSVTSCKDVGIEVSAIRIE